MLMSENSEIQERYDNKTTQNLCDLMNQANMSKQFLNFEFWKILNFILSFKIITQFFEDSKIWNFWLEILKGFLTNFMYSP